jgi:hypothetical protein
MNISIKTFCKLFFVSFLVILFNCAISFASAYIFTFDGAITEIITDNAGIVAGEGYEIGDSVYAQFYVDFDRDGYWLHNDGSTEIAVQLPNSNVSSWYFFTSLIDATLLPEKEGGWYNDSDDLAEYHVGYNVSGPLIRGGNLSGGYGDSYINIFNYTDDNTNFIKVQDWVVGDVVEATITGWGSSSASEIRAEFVIAGIEPVPVPASVIVLGIGLLTLSGIGRKRIKFSIDR